MFHYARMKKKFISINPKVLSAMGKMDSVAKAIKKLDADHKAAAEALEAKALADGSNGFDSINYQNAVLDLNHDFISRRDELCKTLAQMWVEIEGTK